MSRQSRFPPHMNFLSRRMATRDFPGPVPLLMLAALLAFLATSAPRSAEPTAPAGPSALELVPVGSIVAFGGPATRVVETSGWLMCDGREVSATAFPTLHAVLGSAWGEGSASGTFRLPDLRGRFLRGVNYAAPGEGRDPDALQRGFSAPGGNTGDEVGSLQEDTAGPHTHPLVGVGDAIGQGQAGGWIRFHENKVPDAAAPVFRNTWAVEPPGAAETRPRNVAVNWIIRAR